SLCSGFNMPSSVNQVRPEVVPVMLEVVSVVSLNVALSVQPDTTNISSGTMVQTVTCFMLYLLSVEVKGSLHHWPVSLYHKHAQVQPDLGQGLIEYSKFRLSHWAISRVGCVIFLPIDVLPV